MILLGEAFYYYYESLNLSFKGGGMWFIPLMVIGGRHRASKCRGSGSIAYFLVFFTNGAN